MSAVDGDDAAPDQPRLRIVRGDASPEDIAVLITVMQASGGDDVAPPERVRRGGWDDPSAQHRRLLLPGPNGWRSGL